MQSYNYRPLMDKETKNQNNATGLTIDPVPPLIIKGVTMNRKSFLLSNSQVSFRRFKSKFHNVGNPIYGFAMA